MKFWFDVLTPKQVNFFKPLVDELRNRKHNVLCTGRNYREVGELAKIKNFEILVVGAHGGESLYGKLYASAQRVEKLIDIADKFKPHSLISLASPEASRVAFGLGIRHVGFCDAPHAEAVCRLSIPLMNSLMCPSIIPAMEFTKYGIDEKKLIRYRALDPAMWLRNGVKKIYKHSDLGLDSSKKTITFRFEESQAAYLHGLNKSPAFKMLGVLVNSFDYSNIVVLSRYAGQIEALKKEFASKAVVIEKVIDGTSLLMLSDIFIGSGGTMNWECALLGIPNISYTSMKYHVNEYLIKKALVVRCTDAAALRKFVSKMLFDDNYRKSLKRKSKSELSQMEDLKKRSIRVLESMQQVN
ncbi:MAG: DUF354 domain-containing protein [Nitrososphaerales archaeon]